MRYELVFDIAQIRPSWWEPLSAIAFVLLGIMMIRYRHVLPWGGGVATPFRRAFPYLFCGLAILIAVVGTMGSYFRDRSLREALGSGRAQVAEGRVTDFTPMSDFGNKTESFRVGDHRFAYSDYVETGGFNNTSTHGGPVREGLQVRVTYVGKVIVRLEIAP
jgi:hypothetical protein